MAEIVKPDMTALWASGGAVVAPSNNKINEGWTAEIPPHQWENFVQLRQDEAIAYLYQRGIAEWDNTTEYFANKSVVLYNGSIYIATVNNQNIIPTNTTRWRPITGNATTSTAGLMSPADKLKLNGIEAGAQKNTVLSVAGKTGNVTLSVGDVSGALNRSNNLSELTNKATARNNLGLGSAAIRDVGVGSRNLMEVGAFGLGGQSSLIGDTKASSFSNNGRNEFFYVDANTTNKPSGLTYGQGISISYGNNSYTSELVLGYRNQDGIYWRGGYSETNDWQEIYHTGNFSPNTKANTHNPTFTGTVNGITKGMVGLGNVDNTSDLNKPISTATQNALNSKANTSIQIIAGAGLTGGGNLSTNRTLSLDPNFSGNVPVGGIIMWSGSTSNIPSGWVLCNGNNGTPDLRGRFVIGAGGDYSVGNTGNGSIPSHSHGSGTLATNSTGSHSHTGTAASAGSHNHSASTNSTGAHSHSGTASSAGAHTHSAYYATSGDGSHNLGVRTVTGNSRRSIDTSSAGAHTHSLSINSAGGHSHTVSVNSGGAHTHDVSTNAAGSHSHTISGSTSASGSGSEVIAKYYALCYIMRV